MLKDKKAKGKPVGIKKVSEKRKERLSTEGGSELALFLRMYSESRISDLSGKPLPYGPGDLPNFVKQFLHVLPKNTNPNMRTDQENVLRGTPYEHENQNKFTVFNEMVVQMKRKYNGLTYYCMTFRDLGEKPIFEVHNNQ